MRTLVNFANLFNPLRGISPLRYFLYQGTIAALTYLALVCSSKPFPYLPPNASYTTSTDLIIVYLPLVLSLTAIVQRLKDCGANSFWAVLVFFPITQACLVAYLFMVQGTTKPSTPEPTGIVLVLWSLVALAAWLALACAMLLYALFVIMWLALYFKL